MAAALGHLLVLNVTGGDARALVGANGAGDVHGVAVAGVGVGDHRQLHRVGDASGLLDHFSEAQKTEIGNAQS